MSSLDGQTEISGLPLLADFEPPHPDAVRGLNDIAAFLDAYDLPEAAPQTRLSDLMVIALAWAGVVLLFCYPHLQLVLLGSGAILLGIKGAITAIRRHKPAAPSLQRVAA
jgi:hypothetical protein